MANSKKQKGYGWEKDLVNKLNKELPGTFKRIPGSGSFGTVLKEGLLTGDVVGKVDNIPNTFRIECKVGYGSAKSLRMQKEWLDKIKKEAESTYSIPALACKFSGAMLGVKQFIVLDIDTFILLVRMLSEAKDERMGTDTVNISKEFRDSS